MILKLYNVRMKPSNVRKKNKGTIECDKVQSYMMLKLYNMRMKLSNVRKKKGITECDKRTIICDVEIV